MMLLSTVKELTMKRLIQKFFASETKCRPSVTLEEVMFKAYTNTFAELSTGRCSLLAQERKRVPAYVHTKRPGLFD